MTKIKTRFAPSPTGDLHIGGLRTAVYAYALAKSEGGKFVLRIEDTDKKREKEGSKEEIERLLRLFGLNWDEYYVQSERVKTGIYEKAAQELVKKGLAFYCQCPPKDPDKKGLGLTFRDPCRDKKLKSGAIKLKIPDSGTVSFFDFVLKKNISWDLRSVSDTTLLKSDGFPTYHLAVVVDVRSLEITHVLRGHDWLPSTPVHLLVYQGLSYKIPQIGHLTDILDPEGGKLSKRKGSVSCRALLNEGYLPEALLNFVILLGWAPKDNREFFTLDEFVANFKNGSLQTSNPVFNREKLNWMNGEYIRKTDNDRLSRIIFDLFGGKYPLEKIQSILPLVKERMKVLREFEDLALFFFERPKVDISLLGKNWRIHIKTALIFLTVLTDWSLEAINKGLLEEIRKNNFKTGDFFMDLRIAITGKKITPPINESLVLLGKTEVIDRLKKLI